jgi:lipoprotein-anchoring transpeptidase ErfK/SrfK
MRCCVVALAAVASLILYTNSARAGVVIVIDKSAQRMSVTVDGASQHSWPVSTGRPGYGTPNGVYRPQRLARKWFSRKYYNSPMPYSVFFRDGFAIHGSYEISRLGGPASHGCVRLHPDNAAALFALIQAHGMASTKIVVSGETPAIARPRPAEEPRFAAPPAMIPAPRFDRARWRWENMS